MEQVYKFTDWTSASKMKNQLDPCLSVDIGIIRGGDDNEDILGYQLTVINTAVNRIVYKYYIDYGVKSTWSLTTAEAIEMLNLIGFPCEYATETYDISKIRETLESLLSLGYEQISRNIRPAVVYVFNPTIARQIPLDKITDYEYQDYVFLDSVPTNIREILEKGD